MIRQVYHTCAPTREGRYEHIAAQHSSTCKCHSLPKVFHAQKQSMLRLPNMDFCAFGVCDHPLYPLSTSQHTHRGGCNNFSMVKVSIGRQLMVSTVGGKSVLMSWARLIKRKSKHVGVFIGPLNICSLSLPLTFLALTTSKLKGTCS